MAEKKKQESKASCRTSAWLKDRFCKISVWLKDKFCKFAACLNYHLHHKVYNPKLSLSRSMAGGIWGQLKVAVGLFVLVIVIVWCLSCDSKKDFVDMVSPVSLRNAAYDTYTHVPQEGTTLQAYEATPTNDLLKLWVLYFVGTVVFSGVLIATITSIFRTWGDRFKNGEMKFWSVHNHIVIMGYNDWLPGMIEKMLGDNRDYPKRQRVVVGVNKDVHETYLRISNALSRPQRKNILVLKADCNNEWDLRNRMRVHKAKEVYILGDGDDAYRLNSFDKILKICKDKKTK